MTWIYVWTSEIKNIYVWTTPVKEVYVWTTKVRPTWWQPWANTIAYYPLTSETTTTDKKWNYNLTNSWNITFGINQWVNCASFNYNWNLTVSNFYNLSQWDYTVSIRAYKLTQQWSWDRYVYCIGDRSTRWWTSAIEYDNSRLRFAMWYDDIDASVNPWNQRVNVLITYVKSSKTQAIYVNWEQKWTRTATYTHTLPDLTLYIWWPSTNLWTGYLSNVIIENKTRTSQEIADYYNLTKWNY